MKTVIETEKFERKVEKIWSEDERLEFMAWIARHPNAGNVIPCYDGVRKVRWSIP